MRVQLPQDFFSSQHHEGPDSRSILRFLHYPAIPGGANVEPNRAGAHSDYGSLTLLFQRKNGGEGLQILPPSEPLEGGIWRDTGMVDDALLVNVGDALELWSGARFKSTLHRVRYLLLGICLPAQDWSLDFDAPFLRRWCFLRPYQQRGFPSASRSHGSTSRRRPRASRRAST